MTVLVYRYGSICEPDVIGLFRQLGLDVIEECAEIDNKNLSMSDRMQLIEGYFQQEKPLFVFSINYFPIIAEVCHIYGVRYLCWTVDSPVLELFSKTIEYDTNNIFLFDRKQYYDFNVFNPEHIFYLPLAGAVERFDATISTIDAKDIKKFSNDISFVGSLYSEKNPVNEISNKMNEYERGYIDAITNAAMQVYGYNIIEGSLSNEIIDSIIEHTMEPQFLKGNVSDIKRYYVAHNIVGYNLAEKERILTLNTLAEHFDVSLYTRSDVSKLKNVRICGGVKTIEEMPKVFRLSKINLNMTMRPIQTGLPLRIFDIMGCGGFLMTNYQEEISDYFEIGSDLETYTSLEELVDKCGYYLEHDDIRQKIARNGYEKVKSEHNYMSRIKEMLAQVIR